MCGCADRMRGILRTAGYTLVNGEWIKGDHTVPDDRVEEDHFRVLIETMGAGLHRARAQLFTRRLKGIK